jgi:hypothetical protein
MTHDIKGRVIFSLLEASAILAPVAARACVFCSAGGSPSMDATAFGFYLGILVLMIMPFAIVASVGAWWFVRHRAHRETERERTHLRLIWSRKES